MLLDIAPPMDFPLHPLLDVPYSEIELRIDEGVKGIAM